jgi:hypothetical protein
MSRRLVLPLLALALAAAPSIADTERREPPQAKPTPAIVAEEFLTHAAVLASEEFVGRESGTEGGRKTEDYVAGHLARMGLEPMGDDGTFFQIVPLPSRNPDPVNTTLTLLGEGDTKEPLGEVNDVVAFSFSAAGEAEGEVVFAGFGLTDAENEYDDFVGLDCQGKVVVILRHAPAESAEDSPWKSTDPRQRARLQAMQSFTAKAARAQAAGAVAVLLVNDYNHEKDGLPVTVRSRRGAKIPVLAVARPVAERLFEKSGATLKDLQTSIDENRTPASRPLGVRVAVKSALESTDARNVIAVRRGSDPALAGEAVVIGAHLDHVGMGWFGSPAGGGRIHNGADDNASGTAALLEIAEWIANEAPAKRSIVIAFWCGEEKGLVGSRHYAAKPIWPLDRTIACVNLDMVGRYRDGAKDGGIHLGGAPTGSTFTALVEGLAKDAGAKLTHTWQAWPQSDHYSFYAKDIPSLFFTTGLHPEYHRPDDDWWLLNSDGAAMVAAIAAHTTHGLADAGTPPEFKKKPPQPVLGVRLADDPKREGALMGMVFPKMGAANAGMKAGDLVVRWKGEKVTSGGALGKLISESNVGEPIEGVYVRDGKEHTTSVTLTGR